MAQESPQTAPKRSAVHERLGVWIGKWHAQGTNYASDGAESPWVSDETFEWLAGELFVVQHWEANGPFIGLGVMSWDEAAETYVTRSYENHGFYREYRTTRDRDVWTLEGDTERARYEFSDDGATQTIKWEWRPDGMGGAWKPLCDRVARKVG